MYPVLRISASAKRFVCFSLIQLYITNEGIQLFYGAMSYLVLFDLDHMQNIFATFSKTNKAQRTQTVWWYCTTSFLIPVDQGCLFAIEHQPSNPRRGHIVVSLGFFENALSCTSNDTVLNRVLTQFSAPNTPLLVH